VTCFRRCQSRRQKKGTSKPMSHRCVVKAKQADVNENSFVRSNGYERLVRDGGERRGGEWRGADRVSRSKSHSAFLATIPAKRAPFFLKCVFFFSKINWKLPSQRSTLTDTTPQRNTDRSNEEPFEQIKVEGGHSIAPKTISANAASASP